MKRRKARAVAKRESKNLVKALCRSHKVKKIGPRYLIKTEHDWKIFMEGLNGFTDDFMPNGREIVSL